MLGINRSHVYPIPEMNIRALSALIMGLLLQWSMVQALPDAASVNSCGSGSGPMACCASKQTCPCIADDGGSNETPAPLAPGSSELKLVFIGVPTTDATVDIAVVASTVELSPHARAGSTAGFPGVPLSVAFCSFVI